MHGLRKDAARFICNTPSRGGRIGAHRVQKGDVIDASRQMRKQIADHLAALPVRLEAPFRPDDTPLVAMRRAERATSIV